MFQISDDILDMDDDKIKDNPNICNIIGKEDTCKILKLGCNWLIDNIKNIECNMNLNLNMNMNMNMNMNLDIEIINKIIEKILNRIE